MDKEKKRLYKRSWYLKNRERAIGYTKIWQKENRERVNTKNQKWRSKNKDKVANYTAGWRARNPEKRRVHTKRWNDNVLEKRREFRNNLRKQMGNRCSACGYDQYPEILHFHHLRDKKFNIGSYKRYKLEAIKEEAKKCILLCPNCHAIETLTGLKKKKHGLDGLSRNEDKNTTMAL